MLITVRAKVFLCSVETPCSPPTPHTMHQLRLLLVLLASSSVPSLIVRFRPIPTTIRRPHPAVAQMLFGMDAPKDIPARFLLGGDLNRRKRASLRTRTRQVLMIAHKPIGARRSNISYRTLLSLDDCEVSLAGGGLTR